MEALLTALLQPLGTNAARVRAALGADPAPALARAITLMREIDHPLHGTGTTARRHIAEGGDPALCFAGDADPDPRAAVRRMFGVYIGDLDAAALERACYNVVIAAASEQRINRQWDNPNFANMYAARCGTIAMHLDPVQYPELHARLRGMMAEGGYDRIATMTARELLPAKSEACLAQLGERIRAKIEVRVSNLHRCPNCGKNESTWREVMTRGTDELMTLLCTCVHCRVVFQP